jgi:hypothetical protein
MTHKPACDMVRLFIYKLISQPDPILCDNIKIQGLVFDCTAGPTLNGGGEGLDGHGLAVQYVMEFSVTETS